MDLSPGSAARYREAVTTSDQSPLSDELSESDITPEISYDQQRFAARPARLRPRARRNQARPNELLARPFDADGRNPAYVDWLVQQSMLADATNLARQLAARDADLAEQYAAVGLEV